MLNNVPNTTSVYADRAVGGRYINIDIDIDRKKAARYALNIQDIQEVVGVAIGGMVSATILTLLLLPAVVLVWKGLRVR